MAERVEIFEVGPRDGLQNEARLIPVAEKIALVDALSRVGFRRIEVTSFVSPKWVPQMADAGAVMAGITRKPGISYATLAPNLKGFDAAVAARADEVAIFGAASEAFSQANINASIAESLARFAPVVAAAQAIGMPVRGYVSCVIACPYEGVIAPEAVARMAADLLAMGCYEISLGDTIGAGRPQTVARMLAAVSALVPVDRLAGHFHDTGGRALANIDAALDHGLRVFDAAVGGLGGCPYAPGAPGNVATEDVARHLAARGFETGLDLDALDRAVAMAGGMRDGNA
ncbi:hydroxymethylglutaryl-CoA lyase [Roseicyclus sp.]|uniref:hydroxymethylglutaryl-CoA lyase n=1 Tax=Roseicyclus sp. TaxID=1914329 RepID=UPI001BCF4A18|nr:hydroxymethylglutaryl-CoA lyase [Roseicyclus sp.]